MAKPLPDQPDFVLAPPEFIDACATCGWTAWKDNYPCYRCGGCEKRRYVPEGRSATEHWLATLPGYFGPIALTDHAEVESYREGGWQIEGPYRVVALDETQAGGSDAAS